MVSINGENLFNMNDDNKQTNKQKEHKLNSLCIVTFALKIIL